MRAVECDACESLCRWNEAIEIAIEVPLSLDGDGITLRSGGWSSIHVCVDCMRTKSMLAVLSLACTGFSDALREALGHRDKPAEPSGEEAPNG